MISSLLLFAPLQARYARPVAIRSAFYQTLGAVLDTLFPGGEGVPSPAFLHAFEYIGGVFEDPFVSETDKTFLKNGVGWIDEAAEERYGKPFYALSWSHRENVLREVAKTAWGDGWVWSIFSFTFEALLGDPVYGINTRESGWRWLGHESGYPRPSEPFVDLPGEKFI